MICFIVNSIAGKGKAARVMERLAARMHRERIPHDIRYTIYAGHAVELARAAVADGYGTVVCVGGDGTVGEVAAGIRGTQTELGIIPGGSGNDYCRCLRIPRDPERALDVVLAGKKRAVDAIDVNGRLFMNIVNIGFGNEVSANADRYKRFGELAYLLSVFYTLIRYRGMRARFVLDGQPVERPILLMDAGCGTHLGGGMMALPGADPFDGWMDVCYVDKVSPMTVIRLLPKYMAGKHIALPIAHACRCRRVTLECPDGPFSLGGDGERLPDAASAVITVVPAALTVLTPLAP